MYLQFEETQPSKKATTLDDYNFFDYLTIYKDRTKMGFFDKKFINKTFFLIRLLFDCYSIIRSITIAFFKRILVDKIFNC